MQRLQTTKFLCRKKCLLPAVALTRVETSDIEFSDEEMPKSYFQSVFGSMINNPS